MCVLVQLYVYTYVFNIHVTVDTSRPTLDPAQLAPRAGPRTSTSGVLLCIRTCVHSMHGDGEVEVGLCRSSERATI